MTLPDFGHKAEILTTKLIDDINSVEGKIKKSELPDPLKNIKYSKETFIILSTFARKMIAVYDDLNNDKHDGHPHQ